MALSPLQNEEEQIIETPSTVEPSYTYGFDVVKGEFTDKMVDDKEALRQFIIKSIYTARFRYLIYTADYGCELEDLIGEDVTHDFLENEIPRMLTEALIYDERIEDVQNIIVEKIGDTVTINFRVVSSEGFTIDEEVSF